MPTCDTIRNTSNGTWTGLGDVFGQITNPGTVRAVAGAQSGFRESQIPLRGPELCHTISGIM